MCADSAHRKREKRNSFSITTADCNFSQSPTRDRTARRQLGLPRGRRRAIEKERKTPHIVRDFLIFPPSFSWLGCPSVRPSTAQAQCVGLEEKLALGSAAEYAASGFELFISYRSYFCVRVLVSLESAGRFFPPSVYHRSRCVGEVNPGWGWGLEGVPERLALCLATSTLGG